MRNCIFGLVIIVSVVAIGPTRAADGLPVFDIARNCKLETAGSGMGNNCTTDETDARNQLARRWSSFSASQKSDCIGESSAGGGESSYVELLTCLEMSSGQFEEKK